MNKSKSNKIKPRRTAFKITLIYFVVSTIWIISSDQLLSLLVTNSHLSTIFAIVKGTVFIILTSILIYFLVFRNLDSIKESEERFFKAFSTNPIAIILTEEDGRIIDANESYLELTGFEKNEIIGVTSTKLSITSEKVRNILIEEFREKGEIKDLEAEINIKSGEKRTVLVTTESMLIEGKNRNINYLYDITERKKAVNKLESSLNEKEALLREVHHRVKNNLQIISSLLNLQSNYVEDDFKDILLVTQSRIRSMAMIHSKMYNSNDLTHIHIKNYIDGFLSDLFYLYGVDKTIITLNTDIEDLEMGIDTAIPLGLIINELIINILKHAFPNNQRGNILISLKTMDDKFILKICDNGVGLPEKIISDYSENLGLQLVNNLVEQIEGSMEISTMNGTEFKIKFKELIYKKRI
ncbi:MAG: histidine kinase [Methanobacteriales archaeon HGW-Methanobacteriales-1]|jgi:PAS domain S-box-containing protein|nr:MAG: histidine kinase [Methanobacteriales archaeon HGW-Methanobacteriales-1]